MFEFCTNTQKTEDVLKTGVFFMCETISQDPLVPIKMIPEAFLVASDVNQ